MPVAFDESGHFCISLSILRSHGCPAFATLRSICSTPSWGPCFGRRTLSLCADRAAEGVSHLAIDRLWSSYGCGRDLRMRGDIHLAHLFNCHVRIWIGQCLSVKDEFTLEFFHLDRHCWVTSELWVRSVCEVGAAVSATAVDAGCGCVPGAAAVLSVHHRGRVSSVFGLGSSFLLFSSFLTVLALALDLFRSSIAFTASAIWLLARSSVS